MKESRRSVPRPKGHSFMRRMNKHIKKAIAEAFFDEKTSVPCEKMYNFSEAKMVKLAELVVTECAELCLQIDQKNKDQQLDPGTCQYIHDFLKKHFDVNQDNAIVCDNCNCKK